MCDIKVQRRGSRQLPGYGTPPSPASGHRPIPDPSAKKPSQWLLVWATQSDSPGLQPIGHRVAPKYRADGSESSRSEQATNKAGRCPADLHEHSQPSARELRELTGRVASEGSSNEEKGKRVGRWHSFFSIFGMPITATLPNTSSSYVSLPV